MTNPSPITPPLTPASSTSSHVHSRSHSFTPRLPSKLSSQKSGLLPPSPKRKGSASSESRDSERDKASIGSGPSGRSPFPFGFGGSTKSLSPVNIPDGHISQGPSSPGLLAPPTIIEPEDKADGGDNNADKRASQMVHQSGFINRMTDFSPSVLNSRAQHGYMTASGHPVLAKGWKPFKLVLKGSKLYFYKPPSDRSAGIRELFPTELVTTLNEIGLGGTEVGMDIEGSEMDMVGRGGGDGKGKEREEMRRRRAYWGRGTHPALVVDAGAIEKGTTEALVHEAVFATTFTAPRDELSTNSSRYKPEWREFATAILLCVPILVGKGAFETVLLRYCSNLVSGAADDAQSEELQRVRWLAAQYLDYHGVPENQEGWDAWVKDTIPQFSPRDVIAATSSSTITPTHPPPPTGSEEVSPNLGTFSPRPGDSRMQSIVEALGESPAPLPRPPTFSLESLRTALAEEGLSRDLLLNLDPALVARSLFAAQKDALQTVPAELPVDSLLASDAGEPSAASVLAPFSGSDERPHWLTRLVLIQVLVPEPAGAAHLHNGGRHQGANRPHSRTDVVGAWVRVGECARRAGDECSWRAIMAALCSRPIARLDKVWKRADAETLTVVQRWAQILVRGDQPTPTAPLALPWAGDTERELREALERARGSGEGEEWFVRPMGGAREAFDALKRNLVACAGRLEAQGDAPEAMGVDVLVAHWKTLSSDGANRGLAAKFLR